MKIQDLRVGNWVNLHKNVEYNPYQISSGFDLYKLDESDCADITPIILTREILLKCGGKTDADFNETYDFGYLTYNFTSKVLYFGIESVNVKCLHELQNIYFVLMGKELSVTKI